MPEGASRLSPACALGVVLRAATALIFEIQHGGWMHAEARRRKRGRRTSDPEPGTLREEWKGGDGGGDPRHDYQRLGEKLTRQEGPGLLCGSPEVRRACNV